MSIYRFIYFKRLPLSPYLRLVPVDVASNNLYLNQVPETKDVKAKEITNGIKDNDHRALGIDVIIGRFALSLSLRSVFNIGQWGFYITTSLGLFTII